MTTGVRIKGHQTVKYAEEYLRRGFAPIPVPLGQKNPGYEGWNETPPTPEELGPIFGDEPVNIGLLLGDPSRGLTDTDLDVPEAVAIAPAFLPSTVASGRENNPRSHRFYISPGAKTVKYKDVNREMLLELRSDGHQTLVAPSVHPDGDRYLWDLRDGSEPTYVSPEELVEMCNKVATATLIARHLPPVGGRHDYAMALAGYLLRPGRLDGETTERILKEAWSAAGGDSREAIRDIEGIVKDTARKIEDGEPVVGGPVLESIAPGVVGLLARWWGWSKDAALVETMEPPSGSKPMTGLPPAVPFPGEVLTPTMKRIVEEAAASIGCPPDLVAVPMLATLGAAIGNSYMVRIKEDWSEGAALYTAVIADPGEKKTPAFNRATGPAWERQDSLRRTYRDNYRRYQAETREWEVAKKQAIKDGKPIPEPPEEPVMSRTIVEDTTIEALVDVLGVNPRGVLCNRDELSGWVRSMDQYKGGKGSDRQNWLSMWSGSPMAVDRKGGKVPTIVIKPFVSVTGTIQPDVLPELKNGREDGLLDRFLFAYPEPVLDYYKEYSVNAQAKEDYQKLYDALYQQEMKRNDNGDPVPKFIDFTEGAKKLWVKEVNLLKDEMKGERFPKYLKGPWSKLDGYMGRLSLIMALARVKEPGHMSDRSMAVTEPDVRAAAELLRYFKAHARRVYTKLYGEKPENLLLLTLDRFLAERDGYWEGMTSELYNVLRNRLTPGLHGGEVPFGKWLRTLTVEDGISVEEGHKGKSPIVKLSRTATEAEDIVIITEAQDGVATESPTDNTPVGVGDTEGTEGNEAEEEPERQRIPGSYAGRTDEGLYPPREEPIRDPEALDALFADDDEDQFDPDRIDKIREVLHQNWNYQYGDPQKLVDQDAFYELGFDPSPAEVGEAQWRVFNP